MKYFNVRRFIGIKFKILNVLDSVKYYLYELSSQFIVE